MKAELGLSSGQAEMPAGSSPLKSLFLAAIPCGVGTVQGEARRLIVVPCEKNPHFLQKISPLSVKRWCDGCVFWLPICIGAILNGIWKKGVGSQGVQSH